MKYVWNPAWDHAASRLSERSGLTQAEVECRLDLRTYVVRREWWGQPEDHHLIWDEVRKWLIDVPLEQIDQETAFIPTILPVDYGSGYAEWERAEAEQAWLGPNYYVDVRCETSEPLCTTYVVLAKTWRSQGGYTRWKELSMLLLRWPIFNRDMARSGDEGVVALFRDRLFRSSVKLVLQQRSADIAALVGDGTPAIHLKKPGANRFVPSTFFLSAP